MKQSFAYLRKVYLCLFSSYELYAAFIVLATIAAAYRPLFMAGATYHGDWSYIHQDRLLELAKGILTWDGSIFMGYSRLQIINQTPLDFLQGQLALIFGWRFEETEKLLWYAPIVTGLVLGPITVVAALHLKTRWIHNVTAISAVALYALNTYIFVHIAEAGHIHIAAAYAIAPFVFSAFIHLWRVPRPSRAVLLGFALAVEFLYDVRITLPTLFIGFSWCLYHWNMYPRWSCRIRAVLVLGLALLIFAGLEAYWLVPVLMTSSLPGVPEGYDSISGLRALSFQRISHALTVFHPFWSEPITYFVPHHAQPFFYIFPIVAFGGFLIPKHPDTHNRRLMLFFAGTTLIFAFLVKGSNEPFGRINEWIFTHLPGGSLYRESAKFYSALLLSFAPLLGISTASLSRYLCTSRYRGLVVTGKLLPVLMAISICATVAPAWSGKLGGNFMPRTVTPSRARVAELLRHDPDYGRVLWLPGRPLDAPATSLHPVVHGVDEFRRYGLNIDQGDFRPLTAPGVPDQLRRMQIRYIIVPAEIDQFFPGRREPLLAALNQLAGFERIDDVSLLDIGETAIYVARDQGEKPQFQRMYLTRHIGSVTARADLLKASIKQTNGRPIDIIVTSDTAFMRMIDELQSRYAEAPSLHLTFASETRYEAVVYGTGQDIFLVLAEQFHPQWILTVNGKRVEDARHFQINGYANGWYLPSLQNDDRVTVYFAPQEYVPLGLAVSAAVALSAAVMGL